MFSPLCMGRYCPGFSFERQDISCTHSMHLECVLLSTTIPSRFWCVNTLSMYSTAPDRLKMNDVKMEIPVFIQSLKSSILNSDSFSFIKPYWEWWVLLYSRAIKAYSQYGFSGRKEIQLLRPHPRIPPYQKVCQLIPTIYFQIVKDYDMEEFRPFSEEEEEDNEDVNFNQVVSGRIMFLILLVAKLIGVSGVLSKKLIRNLIITYPRRYIQHSILQLLWFWSEANF